MYERMLDKEAMPGEENVNLFVGKTAVKNMEIIFSELSKKLDLNTEMKFPFGNNYGWGYKVSNKSKHLFYLFFEKGSITAMMQLKKIGDDLYEQLSGKGKEYWDNRYPCGDGGGWIHYRILNKDDLRDMGLFLSSKSGKEIQFVK